MISTDELIALQQRASRVFVHHAVVDYVVRLVIATREPAEFGMPDVAGWVSYGASPRASLGLIAAGRALALLRGRDYVLPQDVLDVAIDVLPHRMVLSYDAIADGVTAAPCGQPGAADGRAAPGRAPAAGHRRLPGTGQRAGAAGHRGPPRRVRQHASRRLPTRPATERQLRRSAAACQPAAARQPAPADQQRPARQRLEPAGVSDPGRLSSRPDRPGPVGVPAETEAVLRRLEYAVRNKLDGLLQGSYLGLVPGPGQRPGGVAAVLPGR